MWLPYAIDLKYQDLHFAARFPTVDLTWPMLLYIRGNIWSVLTAALVACEYNKLFNQEIVSWYVPFLCLRPTIGRSMAGLLIDRTIA